MYDYIADICLSLDHCGLYNVNAFDKETVSYDHKDYTCTSSIDEIFHVWTIRYKFEMLIDRNCNERVWPGCDLVKCSTNVTCITAVKPHM